MSIGMLSSFSSQTGTLNQILARAVMRHFIYAASNPLIPEISAISFNAIQESSIYCLPYPFAEIRQDVLDFAEALGAHRETSPAPNTNDYSGLPAWLQEKLRQAKAESQEEPDWDADDTDHQDECENASDALDLDFTHPASKIIWIFGSSLDEQHAALRKAKDGCICLVAHTPNEYLLPEIIQANRVPAPPNWKTADSMFELLRTLLLLPSDYPLKPEAWMAAIQYVDFPADMKKLTVEAVLERLKQSVERVAMAHGFASWNSELLDNPLDRLPGIGVARLWATDLITEMQACRDGRLSWSAIDRGALLSGLPGVGKTTLASLIAEAAGIPILVCSYGEWHQGRKFHEMLTAMSEFFEQARKCAPCIVLIDEIDSFGNRSDMEGPNKNYEKDVLNALLCEIDKLMAIDGIVLMGATNIPADVDPALRRSGRLDRIIEIPLPDATGRQEILAHYLRGEHVEIRVEDMERFGTMSVGKTGADIRRIVKSANRMGRKSGRGIHFTDLADALFDIHNRKLLPDDIRVRLAAVLAGQILASVLDRKAGADLNYIVLDHLTETSLGLVSRTARSDLGAMTRSDLEAEVDWLLSGRAAESLVFGDRNLSTITATHLMQATDLTWQMNALLGLSRADSLLATGGKIPFHAVGAEQVEAQLQASYRRMKQRLKANRSVLIQVQHLLLQQGSLTGEDVRIFCEYALHSSKVKVVSILDRRREMDERTASCL